MLPCAGAQLTSGFYVVAIFVPRATANSKFWRRTICLKHSERFREFLWKEERMETDILIWIISS